MTTQIISHGHLNNPTYESIRNSHFCKENIKSILGIPSSLSSKHRPSHFNYSSPSSRNSILPQGLLNNVTLDPYLSATNIRRISSSTVMPSILEAGCISLLNYYWRFDKTFSKEETLLGVQIFILHLLSDKTAQLDVNLNILLHLSQDNVLQRPVVIVLSSLLPQRFYLSVLSYLSRTEHPIHILMTNTNMDIIFADRGFRDSDMDRIFISVLDKSYNKLLDFVNASNLGALDKNIEEIRSKVMLSDLYKYGNFSGFRYNSISSNTTSGLLWLFDNGVQYSAKKLIMKLVVIDVLEVNPDNINVILGKNNDIDLPEHDVFYNEVCTMVQTNTYEALLNRISTYKKIVFRVDKSRTCSYFINASSKSLSLMQEYKTISWIHFEKMSNITLKLSSERIFEKNETHLVILTTKDIDSFSIIIDSFFLHKKVHILTNISLDRFDEPNFRYSFLISLRPMNINSDSGVTQSHYIANYISRSSSAVILTTTYKLKSSTAYEIQVNVDDSQVHLLNDVVLNPLCECNKGVNVSLSLDLKIWKFINNWIPSEFRFGNQNINFKKVGKDIVTYKNPTAQCSNHANLIKNKVYGIRHNYKYILNIPIRFYCLTTNDNKNVQFVSKIQENIETSQVTEAPILAKTGYVYNDSRFINMLRQPLHDKSRLYIEIIQSIINDISLDKGIQLRDCYITNQMTSEKDLNDLTESNKILKKIKIITNGCINKTSSFYSHLDESMRPYNHSKLTGAMYRFSVGIDANKWASLLSLCQIWLQQRRLEVHLFCGLNRCRIPKELSEMNSEDCRPEKSCFEHPSSQQIFQYFGVITIIPTNSELNPAFKICILVLLNILVLTLFIVLIFFLRRLHIFRLKYKYCPLLPVKADDWKVSDAEVCVTDINKLKTGIDYHSLKLLGGTKQSSLRLYSSSSCSLQQLIMDCDKSILLQAGYLSSPSEQTNFLNNHCIGPVGKLRLLSHSISELCLSQNVPIVVDRALYSWPLSSSDRHRRSHHSQPPPLHHHSFRSSTKRDCYRLTLSSKLKVSLTFASGAKSLTYSNRTTVSGGESAASDIPNKSHAWWTPLSNCSINNTTIISRN